MHLRHIDTLPSVSDSILLESRHGQHAEHGSNPAKAYFFHELAKRPGIGIRAMDWTIASVVILLTLPLYPFIMAAIRLSGDGPVFDKKRYVGFRGMPLSVSRFRTGAGRSETWICRFLKVTGLERAPMFFGVFAGKLSVVGITLREEDVTVRLNTRLDWYYKVHAAYPGIVTLASVHGHGGNASDLSEHMRQSEHDLLFVLHHSLGLNVRILLRRLFELPISIPSGLGAAEPAMSRRFQQTSG